MQGDWKVLIYDKYCQDLLSPLFNVSELRDMGVTLHMLIDKPRKRVPDVPAIYFVCPTAANIDLISRDCAAGFYDSYHLNFSTSISRELLERLAHLTLKSQTTARIAKVFDQYCDFVALQPRLFSMQHVDSYIQLNDPKMDEQKMMAYLNTIVSSLFSLIITLGVVPVIRAQPAGAAQMVAELLTEKLKQHLQDRNNLFSTSFAVQSRPVLVLLDRNLDLTAPLVHAWTYQALVHDVMGIQGGRVTVEVPPAKGSESTASGTAAKTVHKTYDLNESTDEFWQTNNGKAFPVVAEAVTTNLQQYQQAVDAVSAGRGGAPAYTGADEDETNPANSHLANAINELPKLRQKKKILDQHMNIASSLLKHIKARELDAYFSVEEQLIAGTSVSLQELSALLGPESGKGRPSDKLRLLMTYYLCTEKVDSGTKEKLEALLASSYVSAETTTGGQPATAATVQHLYAPALNYLQQHKFLLKINSSTAASMQAPSSSSSSSSSFFDLDIQGLTSKVIGKSAGFLQGGLQGVRSLLPKNNDLPVSKIVGALMNPGGRGVDMGSVASYILLDPKQQGKGGKGASVPVTSSFDTALVFVLGGGNYVEYQNLQDFAAKSSQPNNQKTVIYGRFLVAFVFFLCWLYSACQPLESMLTALLIDGVVALPGPCCFVLPSFLPSSSVAYRFHGLWAVNRFDANGVCHGFSGSDHGTGWRWHGCC